MDYLTQARAARGLPPYRKHVPQEPTRQNPGGRHLALSKQHRALLQDIIEADPRATVETLRDQFISAAGREVGMETVRRHRNAVRDRRE